MVGESKVKSTVDSTHKTWITFIISAEHLAIWPGFCYTQLLMQLLFGGISFTWVLQIFMRFEVYCQPRTLQCLNRFFYYTACSFMMMESSLSYSMGNAVYQLSRLNVCDCVRVRALRHIKHKSNCHIILVLDVCVNIEIFVVYIQIFALPSSTHTHIHIILTPAYYASSIAYLRRRIVYTIYGKKFVICNYVQQFASIGQ